MHVRVCVCREVCVCVFFTPDVTEGVARFAELQQAAVCVQFTDERQDTEKQPVCSLFLLLLLDLEDDIIDELRPAQGFQLSAKDGEEGR